MELMVPKKKTTFRLSWHSTLHIIRQNGFVIAVCF